MNVLLFVLLNLLGAMSPGPDFAIVTRYALKGSRLAALRVTLGISLALIVHATYCLLGAAVFLQTSPVLFLSLQLLGALYLGYLGFKMIREKPVSKMNLEEVDCSKAFWEGFFTNLLNPKATLFILSLLTQFISSDSSLVLKLIYGATLPLVGFVWFGFLSVVLTHHRILGSLQGYQHVFARIMGCFLMGLCFSIGFQASQVALKKFSIAF